MSLVYHHCTDTHLINWWNTACHIKLLLTRGKWIVNAWKDVFFSDCHLHTHTRSFHSGAGLFEHLSPGARTFSHILIMNETIHRCTLYCQEKTLNSRTSTHTHTHETVNTIISSTLGWHNKQLSFHTLYLHTQLFIGDQSCQHKDPGCKPWRHTLTSAEFHLTSLCPSAGQIRQRL